MSITRTPAAGVNSAIRRCMVGPAEYRLNSTSYVGNCEDIAAAQSEMRGYRDIGRVQHGEEAAEGVAAGAEQRFNQVSNPDYAKMSTCLVRRYWADFQARRERKALVSSESATKRSSPASRSSFRALRSVFLHNCGAWVPSFP